MSHPNPSPDELTPEDIAFLEAVKAGEASMDQGRSIPWELVRPWLLSWGTDNELSRLNVRSPLGRGSSGPRGDRMIDQVMMV